MSKFCRQCGAEMGNNDKFCRECGHSIDPQVQNEEISNQQNPNQGILNQQDYNQNHQNSNQGVHNQQDYNQNHQNSNQGVHNQQDYNQNQQVNQPQGYCRKCGSLTPYSSNICNACGEVDPHSPKEENTTLKIILGIIALCCLGLIILWIIGVMSEPSLY